MSKMMVSEEMKNAPAAPSPLRRLLCWEGFLLAVTLAVFIGNAVASPYFLNIWNLSDATFTFTEKAIVVLPMAMLIIAREIDLSVASTMALSSTVMGFCAAAGMDTPLLVVIGLGVGLLCGLFNGLLVTRFNLSSIVITIGTMSLYRGITYILLGDQTLNHYPESFAWFGQGYVWGALSFEFALFILLAAAFTFLLHKTNFGRRTYAIGNNPTGAWFSGINVKRHNLVLFALVGLMAGLAAVLLTSRLGSTRPTLAMGWELAVVTMAVLGGVNILGGSGSMRGVIIAAVLMGHNSLWLIASFLFVGYGFLGLVIPTTAVLALEDHGEIAGTASALLGTLHFVIGGIAIGITGAFFDGSAQPMIGGIAICAVAAFLLALIVFECKAQPDTEVATI